MTSVICGMDELRRVADETVEAFFRKMQDERPKDEVGRILLTREEAAAAMGVHSRTLDRIRSNHGLPCIKLGNGKPMFRPEALKEWAAEQEKAAKHDVSLN